MEKDPWFHKELNKDITRCYSYFFNHLGAWLFGKTASPFLLLHTERWRGQREEMREDEMLFVCA